MNKVKKGKDSIYYNFKSSYSTNVINEKDIKIDKVALN